MRNLIRDGEIKDFPETDLVFTVKDIKDARGYWGQAIGNTLYYNQKIVIKIPEDGTFTLSNPSLGSLAMIKWNAEQMSFPKFGLSTGGRVTPPMQKYTKAGLNLEDFKNYAELKSQYEDAKENYESAKNSGNEKLVKIFEPTYKEMKELYESGEDFDWAGLEARREAERQYEEEYKEAIKKGVYIKDILKGEEQASRGQKVDLYNPNGSFKDEVVERYRMLKEFDAVNKVKNEDDLYIYERAKEIKDKYDGDINQYIVGKIAEKANFIAVHQDVLTVGGGNRSVSGGRKRARQNNAREEIRRIESRGNFVETHKEEIAKLLGVEPTKVEQPIADKVEVKTDLNDSAKIAQWRKVKAQYPDALILWKVGDFYEAFEDDAVIGAKVLGLTLAKQTNGKNKDVKLVGFPQSAIDTYLPKLVRAGNKVGIAEPIKGGDNEVIETITPEQPQPEKAEKSENTLVEKYANLLADMNVKDQLDYLKENNRQIPSESEIKQAREKAYNQNLKPLNNLKEFIETKNYEKLADLLHTGNKNYRKFFAEATGITLPNTEGKTKEALKEFTGYVEQPKEVVPKLSKEESKAKMLQAKQDAVLDKKISYSDYGVLTRREFIDKVISEGYKPVIEQEVDTAQIKRIEEEYERLKNSDLPLGNRNIPSVARYWELRKYVVDVDRQKPMKDVYRMKKGSGSWDITKTEYDYALTKQQPTVEKEAPKESLEKLPEVEQKSTLEEKSKPEDIQDQIAKDKEIIRTGEIDGISIGANRLEEVIRRVEAAEKSLLGDSPIDNLYKKIGIDLIPKDLSERAYNHTSHDPDRRGLRDRQDTAYELKNILDDLVKKAKTDEQLKIVADEFPSFMAGYVSKQKDLLISHSNIASSFITGPSNFPKRQMEKRNNAYDNKSNMFYEWKAKALSSINKKIGQQKIEDAGGEYAIAERNLKSAEELQDKMRNANKIVRNKKLSDAEKVEQLKEMKFSESMAVQLLKPDFAGRLGFADYQLTNNNALVKRLREKLETMSKRDDMLDKEIETIGEFEGGRIINNFPEERVQIEFDEIPSEATRSRLKSNGWRWSPKNKAWQRQNTQFAVNDANRLLDEFGRKEILSAGTERPIKSDDFIFNTLQDFHKDATVMERVDLEYLP
ncbi:MAG: hypothetical protein ACP5N7_07255, partial [Candidatus Pacearchaeota archaeon]